MSTYEERFQELMQKYRARFELEMGWQQAQEHWYFTVKDVLTPDERKAQLALQEQFQALEAQGLEEGWLQYEYGGAYPTDEDDLRHPTRTILVKETDEARGYRLERLNNSINNTARSWVKHDLAKEFPNHNINLKF